MNGDLAAVFEGKTAPEILDELGVRIYQPPLLDLRGRVRELPAAFRVPMLVIDFDTEVHMQGILGFLENSTGRYLKETVDALSAIGARRTAATMKGIEEILARHGVDAVTRSGGIEALWAEGGEIVRDEIGAQADHLYVYLPPDQREDIFGMLERFVEENVDTLLQVIRNCGGTAK
jgi:hypothetical protein